MITLPGTGIELPIELSRLLEGFSFERNFEGNSQASVYQCIKGSDELYIKAEETNRYIINEYRILKWLYGKLPVPEVKYFGVSDIYTFLLGTAVKGKKAGVSDKVLEPREQTVRLLADGLKMIQSVDTEECPFKIGYEEKYQSLIENIEERFKKKFVDKISHQYAEMEYLGQFRFGKQTDRPFGSCNEYADWLLLTKPAQDGDVCFTHGDYGLTNTFIDRGKLSGFIDTGESGIGCKWHDTATCVRSIGYHSKNLDEKNFLLDIFFDQLELAPDWDKINYFLWL